MARYVRIALALALVMAGPVAVGDAKRPRVKAPKSGSEYRGPERNVFLRISGKSVEIIGFDFPCAGASGRTSLNELRLKRTKGGYRFDIDAHGSAGYSDGYPDQNGKVHIGGRFTRDARKVRGHFRVRTPRCGDTGRLKWRAAKS
jgi:hypothetical protein